MEIHRCDRLVSTCIGAGHVETHFAQTGVNVIAHDMDCNVVNLWNQLAKNVQSVQDEFEALRAKVRGETDRRRFFKEAHKTIMQQQAQAGTMTAEDAARFVVAKWMCFKGMLASKSSFWEKGCELLLSLDASIITQYKGLQMEVYRQDIFQKISSAKVTDMIFVDPPYLVDEMGEQQYLAGPDFDYNTHKRLRDALEKHSGPWALCHRDDSRVRKLYKGFRIQKLKPIMTISKKSAKRHELLILSLGTAVQTNR